MVLPRLTVLDERYAIGRVVEGPAPFVHVYQAWDLHTEDQVDLYEYFPAALATRAGGDPGAEAVDEALFRYGCAQFLKEASVLASLDHPNLVRMLACFEAHGTAYRVMAHHVGATLASVLEKQAGGLPPKTAFTVLMPVLEGLQAAHRQGLLHGAVSPETVFLSRAGGPMLRDFRTAHLMLAQRSGDWSCLVRDGYSAPEQYARHGRQGPWTDVYGCAALFFEMLTGKRLPASPRRLDQDDVPALLRRAAGFPEALHDLLEQALSLDAARRPRSVQAFQRALLEVVRRRAGKAALEPLAAPPAAGLPPAEPGAGPAEPPEAVPLEREAVEAVQTAQAPPTQETPSISSAATPGAPGARARTRKGALVLAALAVAVLVALSGAYVVLRDDGGEWSLFAHFKAQGDSLFTRANYTAARTEYERALAAQPGDAYVAGRLHETRRRLADVSEDRYVLYLALGDSLHAAARSSLTEGKARKSLGYFAEANRAYYEALKYRPDDQVVLEKGRLTAEGMEQARRAAQVTSE